MRLSLVNSDKAAKWMGYSSNKQPGDVCAEGADDGERRNERWCTVTRPVAGAEGGKKKGKAKAAAQKTGEAGDCAGGWRMGGWRLAGDPPETLAWCCAKPNAMVLMGLCLDWALVPHSGCK